MASIDNVGMSRRNGGVLSVRIRITMNLGVFVRIG